MQDNSDMSRFMGEVEAIVASRFEAAGSGMTGAASSDALTYRIRQEVRDELDTLAVFNTPPHPRSIGDAVLSFSTMEDPDA